MKFKVEPKQLTVASGAKEVEAIAIRAVSWDRVETVEEGVSSYEDVDVNFYLEFIGPISRNGIPQNSDNLGQNLSTSYLTTQVQTVVYNSMGIAEDATEEDKEIARRTALEQAKAQVQPILKNLLGGSWEECYAAAANLAGMFEYVLLPIEEQ